MGVNKKTLRKKLTAVYNKYHSANYLHRDPLVCVRRFKEPAQIEVVGFLAACLAYGRVERIIYAINEIVSLADGNLLSFIGGTTYAQKKKKLAHFKHRFTGGRDIALLLESVKQALDDYGSMEQFFTACSRATPCSMKSAMTNFSLRLREYAKRRQSPLQRSFKYLIPSPSSGSACKRLNMYFRWVIRKQDGIDFGLWKSISPSVLIIPLDVHIARVAKQFLLCSRKSVDWKMAEEITATLREFDRDDPVKYDFSLCRYGMEMGRSL